MLPVCGIGHSPDFERADTIEKGPRAPHRYLPRRRTPQLSDPGSPCARADATTSSSPLAIQRTQRRSHLLVAPTCARLQSTVDDQKNAATPVSTAIKLCHRLWLSPMQFYDRARDAPGLDEVEPIVIPGVKFP